MRNVESMKKPSDISIKLDLTEYKRLWDTIEPNRDKWKSKWSNFPVTYNVNTVSIASNDYSIELNYKPDAQVVLIRYRDIRSHQKYQVELPIDRIVDLLEINNRVYTQVNCITCSICKSDIAAYIDNIWVIYPHNRSCVSNILDDIKDEIEKWMK